MPASKDRDNAPVPIFAGVDWMLGLLEQLYRGCESIGAEMRLVRLSYPLSLVRGEVVKFR